MLILIQIIKLFIHSIIVYNLGYETIQAWYRRVNHYNLR